MTAVIFWRRDVYSKHNPVKKHGSSSVSANGERKERMTMEKQKNPASKSGGILGFIERVGNALPHPFILFLYITAALIVISTLLSDRKSVV